MELDPLFDLRVGHVLDVLRGMPDACVHMAVTSPPYYALRDYDAEPQVWGGDPEHGHEWGGEVGRVRNTPRRDVSGGYSEALGTRGEQPSNMATALDASQGCFCECGAWRGQLGLEPTPDLFIEHLVTVFREVRRVLRPDGSLWVNMGDSYAGGGGFAPDAPSNVARREAGSGFDGSFNVSVDHRDRQSLKKPRVKLEGVKPKDLIGVPWMLAFALRADGWWLRSENIWRKMGGMPESVFDRTSRCHEHIFHLTPSPRYFYDTDAIREPYAKDNRKKTTVKAGPGSIQHRDGERWPHAEGKIKRTVWDMPTADYPGAHFAVFPEELPEVCIKATTSERGCCPACGAPWARMVDAEGESVEERKARQNGRYHDLAIAPRSDGGALQQGVRVGLDGERRTVGWEPTCSCVDESREQIDGKHPPFEPVPCTVLDPFVGSGTSMVVARRLNRASVGIELSETYATNETAKRLATWWKDTSRPREHPEDQLSLV